MNSRSTPVRPAPTRSSPLRPSGPRTRRGSRRRILTWSLLPLGLTGGFLGGRAVRSPRMVPLTLALDADLRDLGTSFGRLAYYAAGPAEGTPLLLVHSINAAASAYEVKPLFEHYAAIRPVYAIELHFFFFY